MKTLLKKKKVIIHSWGKHELVIEILSPLLFRVLEQLFQLGLQRRCW